MNRSNVRQKRSLGKDSPLSKRPKLDFSRTKETPRGHKHQNKESPKSVNSRVAKESGNFFEREENLPSASDWDDDFSGDMLEKVCLIADLSQAIGTNQSVPAEFEKEKLDFEIFESKGTNQKTPMKESEIDCKKLKIEIENLKEKLKTKEGEVHILRSQLKQSEDSKQSVALQNMKVLDDLQKKCNEKITTTEKELESTKSKLLFRDLEYKTLSERCRQLEYNLSKNKMSESVLKPFNMSQMTQKQTKEISDEENNFIKNSEEKICFEIPNESHHEGKYLMKMICPGFFKFLTETDIVPLYSSQNRFDSRKTEVNFGKTEKYKWSELPVQNVFLKDLYNSVSSLFTYSSFSDKDAKKTVETVFERCCEILTYQKKVLLFLEKLQLYNEYDEADHFLLENEEKVESIAVKNLIDGVKLNESECAIEGRRSLALVNSMMEASKVAFDLVKTDKNFIELLKSLSSAVGTLRRPLRYNGVLIGVCFILEKVLRERNLTKEILTAINETVVEIIFARPKLDVLKEVVNVLAAGKEHLDFLAPFCKVESVDSCTLYMDCKLRQAMFFTKDACPLKLLCMQIMSQACLPSGEHLMWEITESVIKWLNDSINTAIFKKVKWLPINSVLMQEDRCFNVTECLLYLLTLCLKDYNSNHIHQDQDDSGRSDKIKCIRVIAQGAVLLKRILKTDSRQLHENTHSTRFAVLLKAFMPSKSDQRHRTHIDHMTSLQVEAITWITDLIESDFANADCYLKQNTFAIPDSDLFNSLKINDNIKNVFI